MKPKGTHVVILAAVLMVALWQHEFFFAKRGEDAKVETGELDSRVVDQESANSLTHVDANSEPARTPVTQDVPSARAANSPDWSGAAQDPEKESLAKALQTIDDRLRAGDPLSLRSICETLRDPRKEVRLASREALREAGERSAIPDIQMAADEATDPQERAELVELADYLSLPTWSELKAAGVVLDQPNAPSQLGAKQRHKSLGSL